MKPFRVPTPLPWLLILAAIILCGITSCGISNKNKNSSSSTYDSAGTGVKKSTEILSNDSGGKRTFENTVGQAKTTENATGLQLKFTPGGSIKPTGPVVISTDSAGNVYIDPGGRPLESIVDTRTKKTSTTKTKTTKGSDSSHVVDQRTVNKSDSSHGQVKAAAAASNSNTFRINIPWWVYVLVAAAILFRWQIWPWLKRIGLIKSKTHPSDKTNTP